MLHELLEDGREFEGVDRVDQLEIYDTVSWYITAGISSTVIKCNSRTKSTTDILKVVYDS